MKKIILLVVCVLASFSFLTAHNIETGKGLNEVITGRVVDSESGEALVGVSVKVENSDYEVYTDFDGNFEIKLENKLGNTENIIISYISYKEKKVQLNSASNSTIEIDQVL